MNDFDKTPNDQISVLSSCRTIGERIDTKQANMCVFVDPKQSYKDIIQNIGRILRKIDNDDKPGTILIPVFIDYVPYQEVDTVEERDVILRENPNTNDDYNGIMNVVSALKQDNEEYFDMCLGYPKVHSSEEIIKNEGKKQVLCGDLKKVLKVMDIKIKNKYNQNIEKKLNNIAKDNNVCINIWSTDENIHDINHGIKGAKNVTMLKHCTMYTGFRDRVPDDSDDDNSGDYKENEKKEFQEKKRQKLKDLCQFKVHADPDFKVFWNIQNTENILDGMITNCVVDCVIMNDLDNADKWEQKLVEVKQYIDENESSPSTKDKSNDIKQLANWIGYQQNNYPEKKYIIDTFYNWSLLTLFIIGRYRHFL